MRAIGRVEAGASWTLDGGALEDAGFAEQRLEGGEAGGGKGHANLDGAPDGHVGEVVEIVWVVEDGFGIKDADDGCDGCAVGQEEVQSICDQNRNCKYASCTHIDPMPNTTLTEIFVLKSSWACHTTVAGSKASVQSETILSRVAI